MDYWIYGVLAVAVCLVMLWLIFRKPYELPKGDDDYDNEP